MHLLGQGPGFEKAVSLGSDLPVESLHGEAQGVPIKIPNQTLHTLLNCRAT